VTTVDHRANLRRQLLDVLGAERLAPLRLLGSQLLEAGLQSL
jgi:hypothetical protein